MQAFMKIGQIMVTVVWIFIILCTLHIVVYAFFNANLWAPSLTYGVISEKLAYKLFLYMYGIPNLDTVFVFLHKQFKSNMKDCHSRTLISMWQRPNIRQEKNKGALKASESAIRVPIYHMFCQLSNSLLGSLENIEKTFVHVYKKDFLSNIL